MSEIKKIGILTSGGDAPGMNACLRSVVRTAIANNIEPYFIEEGYYGIFHNMIRKVNSEDVSNIISQGGTRIGTARLPEFKQPEVQKQAAEILKNMGISALVCIGGDGTYAGAQKLSELGINCIALPGTIDNDISSSDYTIGFDTALNTVVDCIDKIKDTSISHKRCAIVEVMGRYCPDLAVFAGLATGAELIVTGYNKMTMDEIANKMKEIYETGKRSTLVVITEHIMDVHELAKKVEEVSKYETRATVVGHIQRGGSPSAMDRVLATRLGYTAVMLLLEGKGGLALGLIDNKVVSIPILQALSLTDNSNKPKKVAISMELLNIAEVVK